MDLKLTLIALMIACFVSGCLAPDYLHQSNLKDANEYTNKDNVVMAWFIQKLDDNGIPVAQWLLINQKIGFIEGTGAIYFSDNNGRAIVLEKNFRFMLVRYENWIHADFKIDTKRNNDLPKRQQYKHNEPKPQKQKKKIIVERA